MFYKYGTICFPLLSPLTCEPWAVINGLTFKTSWEQEQVVPLFSKQWQSVTVVREIRSSVTARPTQTLMLMAQTPIIVREADAQKWCCFTSAWTFSGELWKGMTHDSMSDLNPDPVCYNSTHYRPWTHIALDFVTSLPTSKNTTVILSILSRSAHNCPQPLRTLTYSLIKFSSFMVSDWGPQVICCMEDFLHCPEVQKHASGHETDSVISPSAVRVKLPPSLCIPPCFMSPRPMNYQVVLKAPCAAARVLTVTRKFMLSSSVTSSFEFPTVTSRQSNKLHTFR